MAVIWIFLPGPIKWIIRSPRDLDIATFQHENQLDGVAGVNLENQIEMMIVLMNNLGLF